MEQYFLIADEVAEASRVSISTAYKMMAKLNKELEEKGYLTNSGRVPKAYYLARYVPDMKEVVL